MLEKLFKLRENGTDAKTEVMAGITTFMTMAYILAVNPSILSATGMDSGAIFTSTALAAMIGTFLMAFFANYPFALAPGMGLNAYFAYTVVLGMGYKWEVALTAVFVEGIVFIVLSLTNIREAIFNAIPKNLKSAVSVGIGLFIAFIGLQNANIVVGGSTLLQLFSIDGYNSAKGVEASMSNVGITVILALIGVGITGILVIKNVKGNILWGILITWILGIICQMAGIYVANPEIGFYSLLPDFSKGFTIPSIMPVFGKLDFSGIFSLNFIVVIFAFLFVDMFDTIGTLILSPIFLAIPSFATAPALIVVGFYMLTNVTHIDFDDFSEALPCYICILAMPFFYSISEGISMGVISYVILNLMTGKAKEKKISALMYVLTVLFILKYVFL